MVSLVVWIVNTFCSMSHEHVFSGTLYGAMSALRSLGTGTLLGFIYGFSSGCKMSNITEIAAANASHNQSAISPAEARWVISQKWLLQNASHNQSTHRTHKHLTLLWFVNVSILALRCTAYFVWLRDSIFPQSNHFFSTLHILADRSMAAE
jgi:hypothetical protein